MCATKSELIREVTDIQLECTAVFQSRSKTSDPNAIGSLLQLIESYQLIGACFLATSCAAAGMTHLASARAAQREMQEGAENLTPEMLEFLRVVFHQQLDKLVLLLPKMYELMPDCEALNVMDQLCG